MYSILSICPILMSAGMLSGQLGTLHGRFLRGTILPAERSAFWPDGRTLISSLESVAKMYYKMGGQA